MAEFNNVTVVKKANIYFEGKVSSRTVKFADGTVKTLGFMMPGEYTFATETKEIMQILAGVLDIQLPGEETWKAICAGDSFEVPANSKFSLIIKTPTDYCCSYL